MKNITKIAMSSFQKLGGKSGILSKLCIPNLTLTSTEGHYDITFNYMKTSIFLLPYSTFLHYMILINLQNRSTLDIKMFLISQDILKVNYIMALKDNSKIVMGSFCLQSSV